MIALLMIGVFIKGIPKSFGDALQDAVTFALAGVTLIGWLVFLTYTVCYTNCWSQCTLPAHSFVVHRVHRNAHIYRRLCGGAWQLLCSLFLTP